jgi:hypothetical protein
MKFKYNLSRKNYEKIIRKTTSKNNIYYIILGSLFYLFFIRDLILDNFILMLIIYLIAVLIIYASVGIVSIVTSKLIVKMNEKSLGVKYGVYDCTLTKDKFVEKLEDSEISIQIRDIVKTNQDKTSFEMLTEKMIIVFNKGLFENEEDYYKAVAFVKKNLPKQNKNTKTA